MDRRNKKSRQEGNQGGHFGFIHENQNSAKKH